MLLAEESRRQEAEEAQRELAAKKREAAQQLDQTIRVLSARGYVLKKELVDLAAKHKAGFTENEVRDRIRVRILEEAQTRPKPKPPMDKTVFDRIVECLQRLGEKNCTTSSVCRGRHVASCC